jgi:N-acetylneuraminic acid mutarotase
MLKNNDERGLLQVCIFLRFKTPVWLFCGLTISLFGALSLSPPAAAQTTAAWTWIGGSNKIYQPGQYGTLGTPAPGNIPPGRWDAATWTDKNGNLWLFGGQGYDAGTNATGVLLDDLWEYSPATKEWTWMGGSDTSGTPSPGIYGTLGQPNAANFPGSRYGAATWTDKNGNLWLFGGAGCDASCNQGALNDLWEYSPSMKEWAWMGGSDAIGANLGQAGTYGTLGVAAAGNIPGGRSGAATWTDENGNFWLFGGNGYDASDAKGILNDLWEFDPSTGLWAWVGGNSTLPPNAHGWAGIYGTLGTAAAGNLPGSRTGATAWSDQKGYLWLFGGNGFDEKGNGTDLNDLWRFDLSTKMWAWMGGGATAASCYAQLGVETCAGQPGVYGTFGASNADNIPGGRIDARGWSNGSGNFWLFGGQGYDSEDNNGNLNDLWLFSPASNEWTWEGGNATETDCLTLPNGGPFCKGQPGVYGTLAVPAPGNEPGGRFGAATWVDSSGNLWLFGGYGADSAGTDMGVLNDLWEYQQSTTALPAAAAPTFSPAAGTYYSSQSVSLSDATPGATIYYTTDGSVPSTNSLTYGGPITIASPNGISSETLHAIATAGGYSPSRMASATYTIELKPDFTLTNSPNSLTLNTGQSGSIQITVTPVNGFNSSVTFSCAGLPVGDSCSFSPSTVAPSQAPASTTLTLNTSAVTAINSSSIPAFPAAAFALVFLFVPRKKRLPGRSMLPIAVCVIWLGTLCGCGSGSTHSTTTTVTVTATSGSLQHSTTFALTMR